MFSILGPAKSKESAKHVKQNQKGAATKNSHLHNPKHNIINNTATKISAQPQPQPKPKPAELKLAPTTAPVRKGFTPQIPVYHNGQPTISGINAKHNPGKSPAFWHPKKDDKKKEEEPTKEPPKPAPTEHQNEATPPPPEEKPTIAPTEPQDPNMTFEPTQPTDPPTEPTKPPTEPTKPQPENLATPPPTDSQNQDPLTGEEQQQQTDNTTPAPTIEPTVPMEPQTKPPPKPPNQPTPPKTEPPKTEPPTTPALPTPPPASLVNKPTDRMPSVAARPMNKSNDYINNMPFARHKVKPAKKHKLTHQYKTTGKNI